MKKLMLSLLLGGIFAIEYFHVDKYLLKEFQESYFVVDFKVGNKLFVSSPDDWFLDYFYDEERDSAFLYGIFPFQWHSGLKEKVVVAASFSRINSSNDVMLVYKLKDEFRLSENIYGKCDSKMFANDFVGYIVKKDKQNLYFVYFPAENVMVNTKGLDVIDRFFIENRVKG